MILPGQILCPRLVMFAAHKPDERYLVGGFNQPLSKRLEFVNLDDESPNWMEKKCSKPPTSFSDVHVQ